MRFRLRNTAYWIDNKDKEIYEKYGMKFDKTSDEYKKHGEWQVSEDSVFIDISSIEELINLIRDVGHVIISEDEIEIYDDYRE